MEQDVFQPEGNGVTGSGSVELVNEGTPLTSETNQAFEDEKLTRFSIFRPGYINKRSGQSVLQTSPLRTTDLIGVYRFVTGKWAKKATEKLRLIVDKKKASDFKKLNFYVATFSGIFRYRRASELVEHSKLMVFDFDEPDIRKAWSDLDIEEAVQRLRQILLENKVFETELLFRSPYGKGLKWVVYVGDMNGMKHKDFFRLVSNYLLKTYNIKVDESGKDVCRACFLPYDPDCYINPSIIK